MISDDSGKTLAAASTETPNCAIAQEQAQCGRGENIGKAIAERCLQSGITQVVFDRNGFLYHGRLKALADAAREAGLKF